MRPHELGKSVRPGGGDCVAIGVGSGVGVGASVIVGNGVGVGCVVALGCADGVAVERGVGDPPDDGETGTGVVIEPGAVGTSEPPPPPPQAGRTQSARTYSQLDFRIVWIPYSRFSRLRAHVSSLRD